MNESGLGTNTRSKLTRSELSSELAGSSLLLNPKLKHSSRPDVPLLNPISGTFEACSY